MRSRNPLPPPTPHKYCFLIGAHAWCHHFLLSGLEVFTPIFLQFLPKKVSPSTIDVYRVNVMQFSAKNGQINRLASSLCGLAPPSGKSWIRHCPHSRNFHSFEIDAKTLRWITSIVIFSEACVKNSVHRVGAWSGGVWSWGVSGPGGMYGPGGCLVLGGTCSGGCLVLGGACSGGCLLWGVAWSWGGLVLGDACSQGVCLVETPRTATAAGGNHPTGMHSCFIFFLQCTFYHFERLAVCQY